MPKPLLYGDDAPISALATPPGESALALIRISGPGAIPLLAQAFSRPQSLLGAKHRVLHGWILKPQAERTGRREEDAIDEVVLTISPSPGSFTGEDTVDICCHGGSTPARGILTALRAVGFRDALPGEFSFRAFMNGKLDLTRAESIMELVSAKTDKGRERAIGRLSGQLAREIREINGLLVEALAKAELFLDYSEDEAGEDPEQALDTELMEQALQRLRTLGGAYLRELLYQEGALVVLAGRPNAGKSSLYNALLGEDRAIVNETPGTTRDWIESWIAMEGIPLRVVDTAGLRESALPIESIGIERSWELVERANLVLYLLDGETGLTEEDRDNLSRWSDPTRIILWNKCDLQDLPVALSEELAQPILAVSALTGAGLPELCAGIVAALSAVPVASLREDSPGPGTARQKSLIDQAIHAVEEALLLHRQGEALDFIAPLLREGIEALGEITGEVTTADILEAMFSRFCVGK